MAEKTRGLNDGGGGGRRSYPADELERGAQNGANHGFAPGSNKRRKKRDWQPVPDRIQKDLNRYREEMAEDAPASGSAEDNP